MTSFLSDKIRVMSFICIMAVFYIHAGLPNDVIATMKTPVLVRNIVIGIFCNCAVPMFFFISGFLFFYKVENIQQVYNKMRKRIRTLLIPFIIAAICFPLFFIVIDHIPGASEYINQESYVEKCSKIPLSKIIISLFFDAGNGSPWAGHLWFLRDLIIIVILTPLLYIIRRKLGYWGVVILLTLYLCPPPLQVLVLIILVSSRQSSIRENRIHSSEKPSPN